MSTPFRTLTRGQFAFDWKVSVDGYEWCSDVEPQVRRFPRESGILFETPNPGPKSWDEGPWLVALGDEPRSYAPLAKHNLHHTLAHVKPTPTSILRFANRYGLLTTGMPLATNDQPDATSFLFGFLTGESVQFWQREIVAISRLMEIWKLAREGEAGELGQRFIWRTPSPGQAHVMYGGSPIARRTTMPYLVSHWKIGDPIGPARYYVHKEVNKQLKGHVSPGIMAFNDSAWYLFPDSLLSAIYTMFALEIAGEQPARTAKQCRNCGRRFVPASRSDQDFCDGACRVAWHRRVRKQAERGHG